MRKPLFLVAAVVLAALLFAAAAVWSAFGGAELDPPADPPTPTDVPPPDYVLPEGSAASAFATHTVVTDFDLSPAELEAYLFRSDDPNRFGPVVKAFQETDQIKKPVEAVYFEGDWPEVGARRRVRLSDGHYALERVIINEPQGRFAYQIWGYTTKTGNNVDYIIGDQRFEALTPSEERPDGGSRMTWSYHVRPNAAWKRPLIQSFVDGNVAPFLDGAMERVAADAEAGG